MSNIEFIKEHIDQLNEALETCEDNNIVEMAESIKIEITYFKSILNDLEELENIKGEYEEWLGC